MDKQGVFSLIRNLRAKGIAAGAATTRYERSIARKEAGLAEDALLRLVCALIDHVAELEAENQELRVWVREALLKFTGTRIAVVFTDDRCAECYFCHGSVPRSAKESIPHAATCIITRGEKLLLEGADKEEVI